MSAKYYSVIEQWVQTEESSFISYALLLRTENQREYLFNDVSTDYEAVKALGEHFTDSDISEIHFRDVIDDFIAYQADVVC